MSSLLRTIVTALGLASLELALVFGFSNSFFLTDDERGRYVLSTVSVHLLLVGAVAGGAWSLAKLCRLNADRRSMHRIAALVAVFGAPALGWAGWLLTEGRRVRDLPGRSIIVGLAALGLAIAAGYLVAWWLRTVKTTHGRRRWWFVGVASVIALAALVLDLRTFHRLYPAYHWLLAGIGVGSAVLAGVSLGQDSGSSSLGRRSVGRWQLVLGATVLVSAVVTSLIAVPRLLDSSNASYVVETHAPIAGKVVGVVRSLRAQEVAEPLPADEDIRPVASQESGIDLRDRSVLLITIDALRADRLHQFGVTPEMDRLASEGVVFRRAYAPTPHTSYALASLLTGKFMRSVVALSAAPREHATLPDLLRRYGIRTAAFYPPAVFFVDGERLAGLRDRGYGFEYRKEEYASADRRVRQLENYLEEAPPERSLFVWVHLFEPHEPYEPPAGFHRGDSALARYDGEVAAADHAVGELVRTFRAHRPGATVILTADHGEEFEDHGGYYHGTSVYDEQVRVPLIWSSPDEVSPRVVDTPVETVDIATTLLAALGIPRDARMRGDDLGSVLAGDHDSGPRYAFSRVTDLRMVTDGRYKAICRLGTADCLLFDLAADPGERRNVASTHPMEVHRLRAALGAFLASIPEVEAVPMSSGVAWPPALARAELGDATAGPDLVPLLGDSRPVVRAAASRAVGELEYALALAVLERLMDHDEDAAVRAEAALAALQLGRRESARRLHVLFSDAGAESNEPVSDLRLRAAFALADVGDAAGVEVLETTASDLSVPSGARREAVTALGRLRSRRSVPVLIEVLPDIRVRRAAVQSLGLIGDRRAVEPLRALLETERYVSARGDEARALLQLGDRRVIGLVRRFLGVETSVPGGMDILIETSALHPPSGEGAVLTVRASVLSGSWECDDRGCVPGESATVNLPPRRVPLGLVRIVLRVHASEEAQLVIDGEGVEIEPTTTQISLPRPSAPRSLPIQLGEEGGRVAIVAIAVVPQSDEVAAPAPEPWEAGSAESPRR